MRTAASQKISQVAGENLENMDNNCKQKQIQRKRGAEGTRTMSTQRFMWNYGTSKNPKGLEARSHQILDGPIGVGALYRKSHEVQIMELIYQRMDGLET